MEHCEKCGEPARFNYQPIWHKYPYNPEDDDYGLSEPMYDWEPTDNHFFCASHAEEFERSG